MLRHKDHFHGSDLEKIEQYYGIPKEKIISFSANVNPLGISQRLKEELSGHVDVITQYPDREYTRLRTCIASYCSTQKEHILVGNGATELISLLIQTKCPRKVLILGPTYSEYERYVSLEGGNCLYYPLKETEQFELNVEDLCRKLYEGLDMLILCNPNNPTSSAISRPDMRKILDTCLLHGIFVMIDETYVEFTHEEEKVSSVPLTHDYNNLFILRGTSKFFASPGLRLGYAVTGNQELLLEIHGKKDPWTTNSLAEVAGKIMFQDKDYIRQTRELIFGERERMWKELSSWQTVKLYPPKANFILMKILKPEITAQLLFEHCIKQGLMIRNCSTFPFLDESYVRFCIMLPEQNDLLLAAFAQLLKD